MKNTNYTSNNNVFEHLKKKKHHANNKYNIFRKAVE